MFDISSQLELKLTRNGRHKIVESYANKDQISKLDELLIILKKGLSLEDT